MIALYISEKAVRKEIEDKPDVDITLCKQAISIAAKQPTSIHHIWSRRSRCVLVSLLSLATFTQLPKIGFPGTMKRSWNVKASCIKTELVCNVTSLLK